MAVVKYEGLISKHDRLCCQSHTASPAGLNFFQGNVVSSLGDTKRHALDVRFWVVDPDEEYLNLPPQRAPVLRVCLGVTLRSQS
jgi:hypothetical protein